VVLDALLTVCTDGEPHDVERRDVLEGGQRSLSATASLRFYGGSPRARIRRFRASFEFTSKESSPLT
jgi:hypothetical protein